MIKFIDNSSYESFVCVMSFQIVLIGSFLQMKPATIEEFLSSFDEIFGSKFRGCLQFFEYAENELLNVDLICSTQLSAVMSSIFIRSRVLLYWLFSAQVSIKPIGSLNSSSTSILSSEIESLCGSGLHSRFHVIQFESPGW